MGAAIRIDGHLAERAAALRYGCGQYVVRLMLTQTHGERILVEWPFGQGAAADIAAHAAAQAMTKGMPLHVEGDHLLITRHQGAPVLKLAGAVTVVRPIPQPFHEAAAAAA